MPIPLQRRFSRLSRGIGLLPRVLLFVAFTSGSTSATEAVPERIVWQKEPFRIDLTVGKERRVDFPGAVKAGLPPKLDSMVRVQSIAGTVYLLAHNAFDATRVMVRETDSGRMYLLDIAASGEGGSGPPVEVYAADEPPNAFRPSETGAASEPPLPSYGYVPAQPLAAQGR